ncbi:hypothetical protein AWL63_15415 [Sphingomonas panacis]|uniref:Uncharacterized protein n=1 Tax=Sphingomonas panacis TaxID=1560345 RepID=A0A1B3ZCI6_9SPHN|nr:hypothetical protein AWL63_15415 [Sphingomonas panacis]
MILDDLDHVAEANIEIPPEHIDIRECTGDPIDTIPATPGSYRVRACFAGRDTLSKDGLDGDDRYQITLRPAPPAPVAMVKEDIEPGWPGTINGRTPP